MPLVISDDVSVVVVPLQSSNICCGSNYNLLVVDELGQVLSVWNYGLYSIWNHVYIELRAWYNYFVDNLHYGDPKHLQQN